LLLDIDFFKTFNDLYGHQAGDACLQQVGGILEKISWGSQDLAVRYGGEEFVVLLPGRTAEQAIETAYVIQKAIEQAHIPHHGSSIGEGLTLSIGISTIMVASMKQPANLIAEADKALYEAKRNGRNQIRVYNQGQLTS
jgi:diguanylate cyclase (GGDEF)-like protein